jgi:hypothetical protein
MTSLETVAAQRDELSTKLRAMAQQLAAANAEIARLKAAQSDPSTREDYKDGAFAVVPIPAPPASVTGIAGADIERGALVVEGSDPGTVVPAITTTTASPLKAAPRVTHEVATTETDDKTAQQFSTVTLHDGGLGDAPPKAKRAGLFGSRKP